MADALHALPHAPKPSESGWPVDMTGLTNISNHVEEMLLHKHDDEASDNEELVLPA